jgi:hypothetical protein
MLSTLSFRLKDHWHSSTSYSSHASTLIASDIMPTKTADKHQNKRQINQSHITDFFSSNPSEYDDSVQSSLLSVGMRIRKAVPEGYKTHKTASARQTHEVQSVFPVVYSSTRELTPFCGLHKVGGLGIQNNMGNEFSTIDLFQGGPVDSLGFIGQMAGPVSSQESNYSVAASDLIRDDSFEKIASKRKLEFENDGSDVENNVFMGMSMGKSNRLIAKPRNRRRGYESAPMFSTDIAMDFEEASFLMPSDEMELADF